MHEHEWVFISDNRHPDDRVCKSCGFKKSIFDKIND